MDSSHDRNMIDDGLESPSIILEKNGKLSPEEIQRIEFVRLQRLHSGHDAMHAEMVIIFFIVIIVAQIVLVEWKRRGPKTYQMTTLVGTWIIPLILCLKNRWWRFIFFWLVFSCITGFVVMKAIQKPIQGSTPRLVYKWFYLIYIISYGLGVVGIFLFLAAIFGFYRVFSSEPKSMMDIAFLLLFYGLYYGVLCQDIAEISSDKMASHIGYYSKEGLPTRSLDKNICAVCGNKTIISTNEEGIIENTYALSCDHVFHEFCIRGWCIVGKKQICPYCKEKVDLRKLFCNPWEKQHVLYGSLLDWLRLLIAWQPVIWGVVHLINYVLGLE